MQIKCSLILTTGSSVFFKTCRNILILSVCLNCNPTACKVYVYQIKQKLNKLCKHNVTKFIWDATPFKKIKSHEYLLASCDNVNNNIQIFEILRKWLKISKHRQNFVEVMLPNLEAHP